MGGARWRGESGDDPGKISVGVGEIGKASRRLIEGRKKGEGIEDQNDVALIARSHVAHQSSERTCASLRALTCVSLLSPSFGCSGKLSLVSDCKLIVR